jgi:hypothetical protein
VSRWDHPPAPPPRPAQLEFPLIQDQERAIRGAHARKVAELEAARRLCEDVAVLAGDQRFRIWIANVEGLLHCAEHELRNANDPHALARAQGKVQGLTSVVNVVRAAEAERKALAERLLEEHDRASRTGVTSTGPIHPSVGLWSDHGKHEQREQGRSDGGGGQGA